MFSSAASVFQPAPNPFARASVPTTAAAAVVTTPPPASGSFTSVFAAAAASRPVPDVGAAAASSALSSGAAADGGDAPANSAELAVRSRRSFSGSMFRGGGSGNSSGSVALAPPPPPPTMHSASDAAQQRRQSAGSVLLHSTSAGIPSSGRLTGGTDRRRTTTFGVLGGRNLSSGGTGDHGAVVTTEKRPQAPPSPPPPVPLVAAASPAPLTFSSMHTAAVGRGGGGGMSLSFGPNVPTTVSASPLPFPAPTAPTWREGGTEVLVTVGRGRGRGRGRGNVVALERAAAPAPPSSSDVTTPASHSLTKLFVLFLQKVVVVHSSGADQSAERDVQAGTMLEHAFFKFNWKALPAHVLHEMLAAVQRMKPADMKTRLDRWAVVFFLGCNVNMLERAAWEGGHVQGGSEDAHVEDRGVEPSPDADGSRSPSWQAVLRLALERANILCETFGELFVDSRRYAGEVPHESPEHVIPYSAIRVVLRRIRATFERAAAAGFHDVVSMEAQLLSLVVRRDSPQNGSMFQPLAHVPENKMHAEIARTTAALVCEYACLKNSTEMVRQLQFAESYHTCCADDHPVRCALYFRVAQMIVQLAPLNTQNLSSARQNLARSLQLCDPGDHKFRLAVASWFTAVSLALGMVPPLSGTADGEAWASEFPAVLDLFGDIVTALRCADLALYERVLEERLPQFVECGFGSLMEHVRVHVRTNVVLAYFLSLGRPTKLPIHGLLDFAGPLPPPFHDVQGMSRLWLLPLLMERLINGAVDAEANVLILGQARPFELYDVTALPT